MESTRSPPPDFFSQLNPWLALKAVGRLLRDAGSAWWDDNALRLGASLSYYTAFSLAPLVVIVIAIAGLVFEQEQAHSQVVEELSRMIGRDGANAVSAMIDHATAPASSLMAAFASVLVMLVGVSGAFAELQQGLNEIWRVPPRQERGVSFLRDRSASFLMVLVVGALFLLSLTLNALINAFDHWINAFAPLFSPLLGPTHLALSFGMTALSFAMIFKVLPDVNIGWRDVWISAVATALLFLVGQYVIALYLAYSAVASAFGAAGSLAIILVWVYYSSQILFFGAELSRIYATTYGSLVVHPERAPDQHQSITPLCDTPPETPVPVTSANATPPLVTQAPAASTRVDSPA